MSSPAASVVIPTYQRRELVRTAVDSVLAQTRSDFELIVVDDGSTDGTAEALEDVDPRLAVVRQRNRGVAAARNAGIRRARAPVVAFLDSDDRWLPDHLETVLAMLDRHPQAVLASTCPTYVARGSEPVGQTKLEDVLERYLIGESTGFSCCIAARRWALEQLGGFDEEMSVFEDSDLWVRLSLLGPFAFLARRTVERRYTEQSLGVGKTASGDYLRALERHGRKLAAELARMPGRERLADRARGTELMAQALMALGGDGDGGRLHAALAEACRLQPQLHDAAELTAFRLLRYVPSVTGPRSYALACLRCAEAWPDQAAITAHWLRFRALMAAIRCGSIGIVAATLLGWRPAGARRFIARLRHHVPWRTRRLIQDLTARRLPA